MGVLVACADEVLGAHRLYEFMGSQAPTLAATGRVSEGVESVAFASVIGYLSRRSALAPMVASAN